MGIDNYKAWQEASNKKPIKYVITGVDRRGRRFRPIHTNTPSCYNIWRGSIWLNLETGRKLIARVWN